MTTVAAQAKADAAKTEAEAEIARLIARDTILTAREKALKLLKEPGRARLLILLKQYGYEFRRTAEGKAAIGETAKYKVTNPRALVELFLPDVPEECQGFWDAACESLAVVFDQIKVDKAFYTAAEKAHIKIKTAVNYAPSHRFEVKAHRTAEAKERQENRIIDETRIEMEARVDVLARRMMENNAKRSES